MFRDFSTPSAPSSGRREGRAERWLLPALLLLALALRLAGHFGSGLWYDEIQTLVENVRLPFGQLLTTYTNDNNHPLYSLLARLAVLLLGEGATALRLPALVFGVLSIGLLFVYARRVTTFGEALASTALLATSYHHVWFSQNARGYTMLLFWTLAATMLFERLLAGENRRSLVPFALCLALGAYTHLSAAFVGIAAFLTWTAARLARGRRTTLDPRARFAPLGGLALGAGMTVLLYAPIAVDAIAFIGRGQIAHGDAPRAWDSPWFAVEEAVRSLGIGLWPGLVALAGAVVVLAAGVASYGRENPIRLSLFVLPGVLLAVVALALGRTLWPRFFFFQAGFVLLLLVRGIVTIATALSHRLGAKHSTPARRVFIAAAGTVLAVLWLALLPRAWALPKQDFEGALHWIERHRRAGEHVLTAGLAVLPYARYYETDFEPVASLDEVRRRLAGTRGGFLLSTIPDYLQRHAPALAGKLRETPEAARFRGSVGSGDVVVYRFEPPPSATP